MAVKPATIALLQSWMKAEKVNQAELARRTSRTTGAISLVLSGQRQPSAELLLDFAKALRKPHEMLFAAEGLVPPIPDTDPITEEGIHILRRLNADNQEAAIRFLRTQLELQEERERARKTKTRPAPA